MTLREKALEIMKRLYTAFPEPKIELIFSNPFELLVAVILSAQCTDKLVNSVTPALFAKYSSVDDYADATAEEINAMIAIINFHNTKAKNIHRAAHVIRDTYGGTVPDTMEALLTIPGVARKTANAVLGTAFGKAEGLVVDTHVIRLANKLGLTTHKNPVKIERDLMGLVPRDKWINFSNLLVLHGRYQCPARPHDCTGCTLGDLCPEYPRASG